MPGEQHNFGEQAIYHVLQPVFTFGPPALVRFTCELTGATVVSPCAAPLRLMHIMPPLQRRPFCRPGAQRARGLAQGGCYNHVMHSELHVTAIPSHMNGLTRRHRGKHSVNSIGWIGVLD